MELYLTSVLITGMAMPLAIAAACLAVKAVALAGAHS